MRRALGILGGVLCSLMLAASASASPSARLVYSRTQLAATCPDEPALRKAVAARVGYDPFFPWAKQTVVVQVSHDHGAFTARVQVIDEQGVAEGTRELTSTQADCAELFDAAALAIAIALDAVAPPEPPPAAGSASTAPASPSTPVPDAPVPEAPPPPLVAPEETVPSLTSALSDGSADAPPNAAPPHRPSFFAGVDALGSLETAPSVDVGAAVFAGARYRFLSAALEFRVDAPASTTFPENTGSVSSWLYAGSLVPCAHYGIGSVCAVGMLGSLNASGDARESFSKNARFAAVGGRIGIELGLTERLAIRAHIDLLRNLAPASLYIDEQHWTAGPVAGTAAAGLVVRFP
jgi:hypothetical protein